MARFYVSCATAKPYIMARFYVTSGLVAYWLIRVTMASGNTLLHENLARSAKILPLKYYPLYGSARIYWGGN